MSSSREFRILPATARRHGLPPIGFCVSAPDTVQVSLLDPFDGKAVLRGTEVDSAGRVVGEAEIDIFTATLVIDPDRALARVVETATEVLLAAPAVGRAERATAIELDNGTRGYRVEVVLTLGRTGARPLLPYVTLVALAPDDPRPAAACSSRSAARPRPGPWPRPSCSPCVS